MARLRAARLERQSHAKTLKDDRTVLRDALGEIEDSRARQAEDLLKRANPDLDAIFTLALQLVADRLLVGHRERWLFGHGPYRSGAARHRR